MPGGDRTGPLGQGPMTGRGLGYCADNSRPGYFGVRFGRGWFGRGQARGRRFYAQQPIQKNWQNYPSQISSEEEIGVLRAEADILKEELNDMEARIKELKGDKKSHKK